MKRESITPRGFVTIGSVCALFLLLSVSLSAQPSPRIDGSLVYFPPLQTLVCLGGWGDPGWEPSSEVWGLSATGWVRLPDAPVGLTHLDAVYDSKRGRIIALGGSFPNQAAYAFDGTSWQEIAPPPALGGEGYDPEMIYDPVNDVVVCCFTMYDKPCQTWILQNDQWQSLPLDPVPPPAMDVSFVYDAARSVGVWSNGQETWTWDGTAWIKLNPANHPQMELGEFLMTYDSVRKVALLYGKGETWTWNGADWAQLAPAHSPDPPGRGFFSFGFDPNRSVAVLYGGEPTGSGQESLYNDVWEWTGEDWRPFSPGTAVQDWLRN